RLKLLDAGLIYPIFDSLSVSSVHCVPKKGGFTVVKNEENELIRTRLVTGWRVVKQGIEVTKDQVQTPSSQSTAHVQPSVTQSETPISELIAAPISAPMPNLKPSIPYPSRPDNERRLILNKLPKKLEDPGKFLIPCEFPRMDECLALADLGASINLMPLFVWKELVLPELTPTCMTLELADRSVSKPIGITKDVSVKVDLGARINLMPLSVWEALSLSELTPTCMTLELADRSVSKPIGIAKDVSFKVGMFHFPVDFVVVDFEPDPRVPLILERCFLRTGRALIDVNKGELTLRIRNEAITYNLDQILRYSTNYNQITANKIDVIKMACEEYSQEVLSFFDVTACGNPTPHDDPIVSTTSPTLTPFGDSDFLLFEEADAFLAILNSKPLPPLPNHEIYFPSFKKELKVCEAKTVKSSVDEPPEVELTDLPPHLEYAFWEGDNKFPVIIANELGDEEKSALMKVLKSHKRAITWKLSDIQGINPEFCTHKILMEEDYKPAVQHQRRVNPKIYDVIKKEVEKILDAGLIYPISDSLWVSPMLERLAGNEFYCFLDGFSGYFQIPIDPRDKEKTTFTVPMEHLPIDACLSACAMHRALFKDKMLQRCEDTNLSLNWEKSYFMVKEGIVLGHKISKNRIKVDRAKVDVIAKLPHPTTVKGVQSFLGHGGFYRRFIKDFPKLPDR
nr:DNA-directed DNA polymerase [Tanacetum cinerariifolium]